MKAGKICFGPLVLAALKCYCGNNKHKMDNTDSVSKNTAPNLWVTLNLYEFLCLPVITWNKKHSSKQVLSMIYALGKGFIYS